MVYSGDKYINDDDYYENDDFYDLSFSMADWFLMIVVTLR